MSSIKKTYKRLIKRTKPNPEEILKNAKEILKKVENDINNVKKHERRSFKAFVDSVENNSELDQLMISKITQLLRKKKEATTQNWFMEPHGRKGDSLLSIAKDSGSLRRVAESYCIIQLCIHHWNLNMETTNDTITRIVEVLRYTRECKESQHYYKHMNLFLWLSRLPFREGNTYGHLSLRFPFKKEVEEWTDKEFENVIEDFKQLDIRYLEPELKYHEHEKKELPAERQYEIKEDFENSLKNATPKKVILKNENYKKIFKYMHDRNRAIFIMLYFQLHGSLRQRYVRESDRIISSDFFRYLQYKTQVMVNNTSDDQRTRLAHSLEVAGIAKLTAKQLGCNWELAETISLGHDLGHVPFGHSGEAALDKCLHEALAGRFLHSLQSAKVVGLLARHEAINERFGIEGLCLSSRVIKGILKHDTDNLFNDIRRASWRLQYKGWREAITRTDIKNYVIETVETEWEDGLNLGCYESQIVYWSDKIAYAGHDWDELAKSRILQDRAMDVEHILKRMHQLRHMAHARDGENKYNPSTIAEISTEQQLVSLIRYRINEIWNALSGKTLCDTNSKLLSSGSIKNIREAFKPSKKVFNKNESEAKLSPLAEFVCEISLYKEEITKLELEFFTTDEYELVFDFFAVAHNMIYLTKTYPRSYKKSNDVVRVLYRYLSETNNRCIVQALQTNLLRNSREQLDSEKVSRANYKEALPSNLATIRIKASKYGYVNSENSEEQKDSTYQERLDKFKGLKKDFRDKLQKKMPICLSDDIAVARAGIADFVFKYYIKSDQVRIMQVKANLIISALFNFFMDRAEMLPAKHRHKIQSYKQRLAKLEDDYLSADGKKMHVAKKRLLVIQYVRERVEEHKTMHGKLKKNIINYSNNVPHKFLEMYLQKRHYDNEKFCHFVELKENETAFNDYLELCEHIAKARIIADYIATMTDRYAERKYNEIVSSGTTWSQSCRE